MATKIINSFKISDTYVLSLPYGTCSTASSTAEKTVSGVDNFALETGAQILVKFSNANTASSAKLNVNSTGAKAIYYKGSALNNGSRIRAGETYQFLYNGTQWELIGMIIDSVSNTWANGTTSGPTLTTTVNGISGTAVAIPSASTSQSGIVTTAAQRFRGQKTLEYPTISSNNTRYQGYLYKNGADTTVADHWYDTGDATNISSGRFYWRQYSPNSTANTSTTGYYETFLLPAVNSGRTSNASYEIFTSKSFTTLDDRYVNVTGDTMTGSLHLGDTNNTTYQDFIIYRGDNGNHLYMSGRYDYNGGEIGISNTADGVTNSIVIQNAKTTFKKYIEAPTITINSTSGVKHLTFSRGSANYIAAPTSGYFAFLPNGASVAIANSPFIIDATSIYPGTNDAASLGTSTKRWSDIYCNHSITISGTTDATMDETTTNPRIIFAEGGSQPVSLVYTDYNSYRSPAGLKVLGTGTDASPAWFEVEGNIYGAKVYGAVWNDYAEFRNQVEGIEPGYCATCGKDGKLYKATERLQYCEGIVSDTFGFSIGETDKCKTPLAVSGRVLAYYAGSIEDYDIGDAVCANYDGKITKMTREEIREYPERILGTVFEIPTYKIWGDGEVSTQGRIWIKVK